MRPLALIDAPSGLGLRAAGVERLPEALHELSLLERVGGVESVDRVVVPAPREAAGVAGVLNAGRIRTFSIELAARVGTALDAGHFPLVLGGDCSILLGIALALRRRGRYGLAFLDGHADFYSPHAEQTGEVASMDLAIATGREPVELADIDGLRPYFREQDVAAVGVRDIKSALAEGSPDIRHTNVHVLDLEDLRRLGPREAALRTGSSFGTRGLAGYWVHLDADVLSDELMPAVDYRLADGLRADELTDLLAVLLASPMAAGLDVTVYNPSLDDDDLTAGRTLVDVVAGAFERSSLFAPRDSHRRAARRA